MKAKDFYLGLDGRTFNSFRAFQAEIVNRFNRHLEQMPPHYTYLQLIAWGQKNHWVIQEKGGQVRVEVT